VTAPRFFHAPIAPGLVELSEAESRHALQSLRLQPGDEIVLFDGAGRIAHGQIEPATGGLGRGGRSRGARRAGVRVERVLQVPPPARRLTLVVPGCKGDRLSTLVEKCTELGAARLMFTEFERTVVHVRDAALERLARTSVEACKQCRRAWLPEIAVARSLAESIAGVAAGHLIVADPDERAPGLAGWLHGHAGAAEHLTAVIGPEGGLTDGELASLRAAGGQPVRLGEHILRVETAAIAVAAAWAARG